ncbi:MAG: peptide chain release factor N(5)-glutamine methyltransferase [Selenomonadales bacterium]|jgi:release factor glutamine methyltransferase|nr:peptide chain release factor N(5)-glutamine methyltransferase [Selenomonadales bacterium]
MTDRKEVWTIGKILNWTKQYFEEKGVDSPRLDAEVLLSHILKCDRIHLYVNFDRPLVGEELSSFRQMVKARAQRMPVAYILGEKEFMGHSFRVTPDVLIPRPDTEILVEEAIRLLAEKEAPRIVDIGTGSGAILLSVLKGTEGSTGVAVDLSPAALAVAKSNGERLGLADRAEFRLGDLYAPVDGLFDAILSNPPYIPVRDMEGLSPEVKQEPEMALVGGADGLDFYRRLIDDAPRYLKEGGIVLFEVGIGEAQDVAELGKRRGFSAQRILPDYAGIDRVVVLSDYDKAVEA